MRLRALFLTPSWAVLGVLFCCPLLIVLAYSFLSRGAYGGLSLPWTAENYLRLADPAYLGIIAKTLALASAATIICVTLAFPLALFISLAGARKAFYLQLVMLPCWTSFLIRTYAWMFILRDSGLLNSVLLSLGVISQPLTLLYNDGAVMLGLVYGHLPFAVLPIYASLERLDRHLLEASADLGATPWETLLRVTLPLCAPGLRAGALLAFIPSFGAFLTPDLLGGGKTVLVGNLIQNQFTTARDWPFGSALSLAVMALVLVLAAILMRRVQDKLL